MSDRADGGGRRQGGRDAQAPQFQRMRSAPTPPKPDSPTPGGGRPSLVPSRRVRRQRVALLLAGAMSIVVLLASGSAWAFSGWVSGQMNRFDVFGGLGDRPAAGPEGALNFLVIGSDSRSDLDQGQKGELGVGSAEGRRSDTMMLVHLNHERDAVTVVGIPRDSWVDIPGRGRDKINAAYAHGGPRLAVETVESNTHVRIDHYVEVDFSGFVDVVNALGGIEVCLPEPINDPKAHLDMEAGTHQVDGKEALAFARTRKTAGGDLDRIDRQQQVMAALLNKALSSDTLSDPGKFGGFLDTALGSVTVDKGLDTGTINQLANQLRDIRLSDVSFTTVPLSQTNFTTPHGESAVRWDTQAANELFGRIAADKPISGAPKKDGGDSGDKKGGEQERTPRPEDVNVQVFNGIGTPGLGAKVRSELVDAGFGSPGIAQNWSSRSVATTQVRYAPENRKAAELVSESIPGSELREDDTVGTEVQVVVGINYTSVRAPETPAAPSSPPPSRSDGGEDGADTRASTAKERVCPK